MAWVFGGKKFGQYTYEHWFDDHEYDEIKTKNTECEEDENCDTEKSDRGFSEDSNTDNIIPHKP